MTGAGPNFAMRHPQAVEKLIVLNAPHPQRFLEEITTFSQLRKSWYMFLFQLPWLPEMLIRSGDFAGLERTLRIDPVHPGTFDAVTIGHYKQAIAQPGALSAAINYYRALFRLNPVTFKRSIMRIDVSTLLIWGQAGSLFGHPPDRRTKALGSQAPTRTDSRRKPLGASRGSRPGQCTDGQFSANHWRNSTPRLKQKSL